MDAYVTVATTDAFRAPPAMAPRMNAGRHRAVIIPPSIRRALHRRRHHDDEHDDQAGCAVGAITVIGVMFLVTAVARVTARLR